MTMKKIASRVTKNTLANPKPPAKESQPYSEFVEGVSCLHGGGVKGWTWCPRCGTKCTRDADGVIVSYDRGTLDRPNGIPADHERD